MLKDIDALPQLMGSEIGFFLGVPREDEKVELEGTIDGSNKNFDFPPSHYPIFPKSCLTMAPVPSDITVWTKKDTTYTEVEVASIDTIVDPETGFEVYGRAVLQTAPTSEGTDSVWGICVERLEPYYAQNIKTSINQDKQTTGRIRSKTKHTTYGAIEMTIEQENIVAGDLDVIRKLLFEPYVVSGIEAGYEAYKYRETPLELYGYIPIYGTTPSRLDSPQEEYEREIGRFYFQQCRVVPKELPGAKEGDMMSFNLEISIDTLPILLVPEEES